MQTNRRHFLRSVIVGTLAAPFVTRRQAIDDPGVWERNNRATYKYWQRQALTRADGDPYENLRAAMRDIHRQCARHV